MKTKELLSKASGKFAKVGFKIQKYSPEICLVIGVTGIVTGVVTACIATLKLDDELNDSRDRIDEIKCDAEVGEITPEESKKLVTKAYVKTALNVAAIYATPVVLCAGSITLIVVSHNILKKRNMALAAAYATIDKSFKEYRQRVADRYGEDAEREIRHNIKSEKGTLITVDENGNEVKEKGMVKSANGLPSDYARYFDETNPCWINHQDSRIVFLSAQERYHNEKLKIKKKVFLNEVYEALGFEPTQAGQIVGWTYDDKNPKGDNYIDFGIYALDNVDAVNRKGSGPILLDFNVDGDIWSSM